ncbi:hypothetical protein [Cellulomonas rhizosphaerae]|uniref:Uncharacterized protein n=1 Tax=Cellulomonas rhizosphaerae TaxID=2293719 RepID=A0A413RN88_9CELL|nr:hypothetical protein [Cellulomonas rhizosphaerae]RHA43158.1 hypothetical protein D1825_06180 [Cellulomonas rhizosphaerae]
MTTFEDLDLAEAFGDFEPQEQPTRRRAGWITAVVLTLAVLLVGGGLAWLALSRDTTPTAIVVAPAVLAPALAEAQTAADQVESSSLDGTGIRAASTRFVASSDLGAIYVATGAGDRLCLLAVPEGDLSSTSCVTPKTGAVIVLRPDVDGPGVALVTEGGEAPSADDGWTQTPSGLWTAPAA